MYSQEREIERERERGGEKMQAIICAKKIIIRKFDELNLCKKI